MQTTEHTCIKICHSHWCNSGTEFTDITEQWCCHIWAAQKNYFNFPVSIVVYTVIFLMLSYIARYRAYIFYVFLLFHSAKVRTEYCTYVPSKYNGAFKVTLLVWKWIIHQNTRFTVGEQVRQKTTEQFQSKCKSWFILNKSMA